MREAVRLARVTRRSDSPARLNFTGACTLSELHLFLRVYVLESREIIEKKIHIIVKYISSFKVQGLYVDMFYSFAIHK